MDHAHANTFTPMFVPKATLLPEVIVKPDDQINNFFLSWHLLGPYTFQTGVEVRTS
jgi:hypothetical protein